MVILSLITCVWIKVQTKWYCEKKSFSLTFQAALKDSSYIALVTIYLSDISCFRGECLVGEAVCVLLTGCCSVSAILWGCKCKVSVSLQRKAACVEAERKRSESLTLTAFTNPPASVQGAGTLGITFPFLLLRTNSDSALHTSAMNPNPQDPFGMNQQMGRGPPQRNGESNIHLLTSFFTFCCFYSFYLTVFLCEKLFLPHFFVLYFWYIV